MRGGTRLGLESEEWRIQQKQHAVSTVQQLMFLTKHAPTIKNKDKNKPKRILGGWEDDDDEPAPAVKQTQPTTVSTAPPVQPKVQNLLQDPSYDVPDPTPPPQPTPENGWSWDELNQRDDIECEKRVVEEVVQPGGIRIKPSDSTLNTLLKESKGMSVEVIGWLLLSKLEVNYPFNVKAKALYAIQFLAKKEADYRQFFSKQAVRIREYPTPQDNVENYQKILNSVCGMLGVSPQPKQGGSSHKIEFVDPGYNTEAAKKESFSSFLSQNAPKSATGEPKRMMLGPGQVKSKNIPQKEVNLLEPKQPQGQGGASNNQDLI